MKTNQPQKNISSDWQQVKLGAVCDISAGGTPSTDILEYWENGSIPWANSAEINKRDIYKTNNFITQSGLDNSSAKIVPENSVLIALAGQGSTRGKVAVNKIPLSTNQSLAFFVPKKDVDYRFLRSVLEMRYQELRSISTGDGGRGGLNLQILKSLKIKLPPLPEQNRIVSVLETWDKSIEKLARKIEVKKQIKKALMDQYVYKRKDSTEYFIDSLFELGRGRVIARGEIENNPGIYPVYSSQTSNSGIFGNISTYDFEGEYLTWTTDGANAGRVFYRTGKFNCTNVCGTAKLKKDLKVNLYFVYSYLNYITKNYVSYVGNPKLMNGVFGKIQIKLPDIEEQDKISKILIVSDKEITELEKKLSIIREQKRYLLNNLITGTIRTPDTLSTNKLI